VPTADVGRREAGSAAPDAGADPGDAGMTTPDAGLDSRDGGASTLDGGSSATRVTFGPNDYRRCRDDLECAVFGGNCLVELALSRPDSAGVERVAISTIDPSFAVGEGICTLPCTNDPRICDSITVQGPNGVSAPFSCQVVFAATSPYPAVRPEFPFDTQLDLQAMTRGVPFASICRPPFQRASAHEESFCQPCLTADQCSGESGCYLERSAASPPSGSCVEPCGGERGCPFGFACGPLPDGTDGRSFCLPVAGTCGRCLDRDGDQRGVGRCGLLSEPVTAVDCDDSDPATYFDAADPRHGFPGVCGASDVNCNGLSDDAEQLGTAEHCAACGDVCIGRVGELENARRSCLPRGGGFACVAECEPGWADCDGDVETGCEQSLGENQIWAADADQDGRGSQREFRYVCEGGQPPAGWVQNRLDCDDTKPAVYGGSGNLSAALELCDAIDNDCNGVLDDAGRIVGEGLTCNTGFSGVCSTGTQRCDRSTNEEGETTAQLVCIPEFKPEDMASVKEVCDGKDNNCNGQMDEGLDYYDSLGQTNPNGYGAPVPCASTGLGICAEGTYGCVASGSTGTWGCQPRPPLSYDYIDGEGLDTNCDGSDGNLSAAIFVRPVAGGGSLDGTDNNDGTSQRPVATVQKAIQLACTQGPPCTDIYIEDETFVSQSPIVVPPNLSAIEHVRLYGGFDATVGCTGGSCRIGWQRGSKRSTLVRQAPAAVEGSYPFSYAYAAIEGASASPAISLRLDRVDIRVSPPNADAFLLDPDGQHAPALIGIRCPTTGCADLTLQDVTIQIENAAGGANGKLGLPGPQGATHNGHDGCVSPDNCTTVPAFAEGEWMQYPYEDLTRLWNDHEDGMAGQPAEGCPDGVVAWGGTSSTIRYNDGESRKYRLNAQGGSGPGGGRGGFTYKMTDEEEQHQVAGRGTDGAAGRAGGYTGTPAMGIQPYSSGWTPRWLGAFVTSTYGRTGGGGGGGGGCIVPGNDAWGCPKGEARGGGGGAGGCGGFAGGRAGHGGSAIGLVLSPPPTGYMTLLFGGEVRVIVGNAGKGGNGGTGGNGAYGGYGGIYAALNAPTFNGGNGGDGGGGGGGMGGFGGSAVGIVRVCTRSDGTLENGCNMLLPAPLLAAPSEFVTVGSAGAAGTGGAGGKPTKKPMDIAKTDESLAEEGGTGMDGLAGERATLYFREYQP